MNQKYHSLTLFGRCTKYPWTAIYIHVLTVWVALEQCVPVALCSSIGQLLYLNFQANSLHPTFALWRIFFSKCFRIYLTLSLQFVFVALSHQGGSGWIIGVG